jgi:hypothetical protein
MPAANVSVRKALPAIFATIVPMATLAQIVKSARIAASTVLAVTIFGATAPVCVTQAGAALVAIPAPKIITVPVASFARIVTTVPAMTAHQAMVIVHAIPAGTVCNVQIAPAVIMGQIVKNAPLAITAPAMRA